MKFVKYVVVPTLGIMTGVAHAQSSVTLYGSIDEGFEYISNIGGHANYALVSNTQQLGNRWGIKGKEDLGGGVNAVFQLENGFGLNNGTTLPNSGEMFGRQAYVGVGSDNLGTVTLGRQYDSVVDYVAPLAAVGSWGGTLFAHLFDADNLNDSFRINNAVKYTSADYAGLQFGGVYGFSNQAGAFADNRAWSVGAHYQNGPLAVAAAFMNIDQGNNTSVGAVIGSPYDAAKQRVAAAGANYTIGPALLGLVYTHTDIVDRTDALALGSTVKFDNFEFNAKVNIAAAWYVAAMYDHTRIGVSYPGGENNPHADQFGLMADYRLSKRTDLYVQGVYQKVSGHGSTANIGNGNYSSNSNQTIARVGIRTSF